MPDPQQMLHNNRRWASSVASREPEFFPRLAAQQRPDCLWIGCSDSRVPATQIVDVPPGEIFVHRNVANLVVDDDLNCQSAIQFAVDELEIRHILVCGHYRCAGVKAVIANQHRSEPDERSLVDQWLQPLEEILTRHQPLLAAVQPDSERTRVLAELSVINQVRNVAGTLAVTDAWRRSGELSIHGWVYDVEDGLLKDLNVTITAFSEIEETVQRAINTIEHRYQR